jgi:hypothetical protein
MSTKLCIFNQTTNLIDITDGVATYTGSPATAYAPIVLNAEGALDSSFFSTSTPITATAAVNLTAGQLVNLYYTGVNVSARLASALSTDNLPAMGFVAADATSGATVTVNTQGLVNCPFVTGFSPSDVGAPVYLSTTSPGSVQLALPTPPDLVQPLGYIYQVGGTLNSYVQFPFVSYPLAEAVSVPIATTSVAGIVKPDGVTIDVNVSGQISVPTATGSAFGLVKPDGTTITISGGVISSAAGGITQLTGDVTTSSGSGSKVATLATVNSNVGTYAPASVTVNAKRLFPPLRPIRFQPPLQARLVSSSPMARQSLFQVV